MKQTSYLDFLKLHEKKNVPSIPKESISSSLDKSIIELNASTDDELLEPQLEPHILHTLDGSSKENDKTEVTELKKKGRKQKKLKQRTLEVKLEGSTAPAFNELSIETPVVQSTVEEDTCSAGRRPRRRAAINAEKSMKGEIECFAHQTVSEPHHKKRKHKNIEQTKEPKGEKAKKSRRSIKLESDGEVAPIFQLKKKKKLKRKERVQLRNQRNFLLQSKPPELKAQKSIELPVEAPLPTVSHVGIEDIIYSKRFHDSLKERRKAMVQDDNVTWLDGDFVSKKKRTVEFRLPCERCKQEQQPSGRMQSMALNKFDSGKLGDPWTSKYAPKKTSEVLHNQNIAKRVKEWALEFDWSMKNGDNLDSSDSEACDDDDGFKKALMISGSHGCGKMATVYAVASQLHWKVFEVNFTNCTSGNQLLASLKEVTQSHQVSSAPNTNNQKTETPRCFVVFHAIDCWTDNQGVLSAVKSFIKSSKRPVLLTCNTKVNGFDDYVELLGFEDPPEFEKSSWLRAVANCEDIECICSSDQFPLCQAITSLQFWRGLTPVSKVDDDDDGSPKRLDTELLSQYDCFRQPSDENGKHFGWRDYHCLRSGVWDKKPLVHKPVAPDAVGFVNALSGQTCEEGMVQPQFLDDISGVRNGHFVHEILPFVRRICLYQSEKQAGTRKRRFLHYMSELESEDTDWLSEQCLPGVLDFLDLGVDTESDLEDITANVSDVLGVLLSSFSNDDF